MKKCLSLLMICVLVSLTTYAQTFVSTTPSNKNAILEEFTGINCQYCPDGHKIANQIMAANPGRFWAVNIHSGGYAPTSNPNYHSEDGDAIHNYFLSQITGYPCGTIQRNGITNRGQWAGLVATQLGQASPVNVAGKGIIDYITRTLTLTVEAYYTGNGTGSQNFLTVAMLQDNILGPQVGMSYNPEQIINGQYNHQHMLRDIISPTWGETITNITAGSFYTKTYTYAIPEKINNVDVVLKNVKFLVWVAGSQTGIISANEVELASFAPTQVQATQSAQNSLNINITWQPPTGKAVTGYNVYREGVKLNSSLLPPSTLNYDDVVLEYGKTYCYEVSSIVDGYEFTGDACVQTAVTFPAFQNVEVKQLRGLNMKVTWALPETSFPVKYKVYRNNVIVSGANPIDETSFDSKGLSYKEYCFEIEPVCGEITGTKSNKVCVTLVQIGKPTDLIITQPDLSKKEAKLTWTGSNNATGYNIYRNGVKVNTQPVSTTSYIDAVPSYGITYDYELFGVADNGGESEFPATGFIKLEGGLPTPQNVSATQSDELKVSITWNSLEDIDGYNIYRNGTKINTELISINSFNDNVPATGTYCYTVTAVANAEEGENSEPGCVDVGEVGINETDLNALVNIYPNPVISNLIISTSLNVIDYQIFDINGRLIFSTVSSQKSISTNNLTNGVYIIKITTDKGVINKRFLKK